MVNNVHRGFSKKFQRCEFGKICERNPECDCKCILTLKINEL